MWVDGGEQRGKGGCCVYRGDAEGDVAGKGGILGQLKFADGTVVMAGRLGDDLLLVAVAGVAGRGVGMQAFGDVHDHHDCEQQ